MLVFEKFCEHTKWMILTCSLLVISSLLHCSQNIRLTVTNESIMQLTRWFSSLLRALSFFTCLEKLHVKAIIFSEHELFWQLLVLLLYCFSLSQILFGGLPLLVLQNLLFCQCLRILCLITIGGLVGSNLLENSSSDSLHFMFLLFLCSLLCWCWKYSNCIQFFS